MHGAWKAWAFFKRDLVNDLSYKLSFALQIIDVLLGVAAFYFLAQLLDKNAPQNYASFPFIVVGIAVNGYMTASLVCFAQGIRANQLMGTLKAVLTTSVSPLSLVFFSSLYPLLRAAAVAGLYLLGGILFGLSLARANLMAALLFFLLSLLAFSSIGIISASFTLVFKRGDPLLWLFGSLSCLLGGVFYPLEVLPPFLQQAAQMLPITHVLQGMRAALLGGGAVAELFPQIWVLALFAVVGLPLSLVGFSLGVRRARVTGTFSHY